MKKRIFIIVLSLLLCASATFAWLSNFETTSVKNINVGFDNPVSVSKLDFDAEMWVETTPGQFTCLEDDAPFTFPKERMIPDSVTRFKIKIKNNTAEDSKAKLALSIALDPEQAKTVNLLDVLYLDIMAGEGFNGADDHHIFVNLRESREVGASGSGNYLYYAYGEGNELTIPKSAEVTLDCYFYYSQEATAKYQDKDIALSFRIE